MEFKYDYLQNKLDEINKRELEIKNMQCIDRIDFLISRGYKYSFEYIYGVKYEDIISSTDNLMNLSYYFMFHNSNNLKEFYNRLTKERNDDFWQYHGLTVLEPIIKRFIENEKENFNFLSLNNNMKKKDGEFIGIVNRNRFLKSTNENIKQSVILTAKTILENLSLYERDPLKFISDNNINLISLFAEDIEIYELEYHEFYKRLSNIDNKELIKFLNKFAVNKFKENEKIKDMKIKDIKERLFGNL
ncbi:hypothetical protein [Macrococcoides bohemicum]|uniref:hypothetical protein n=1 Tax=Macrococcoides bohemicum TaxID=1903056 RepID=UPI00165DAE2E|nr:hypothetical protein [Macrococcus bohemicus]MBC9875547.1 hypothetical protein [Macrococcus bohemicus]